MLLNWSSPSVAAVAPLLEHEHLVDRVDEQLRRDLVERLAQGLVALEVVGRHVAVALTKN